jgi:prepilin-type N-terminal cleavage/methylation domain-containing protein
MKTFLNFKNYQKIAKKLKPRLSAAAPENKNSGQAGFSLIEVTIAMVVFLIVVLGVFISFAYAVSFNSGNNSRAQALALLQQKVEEMRSARWVPTETDDSLLGGEKAPEIVTGEDNHTYRLDVVVDNDPFTDDIQTTETGVKFKEIRVTVRLEAPTPGWQTSVPATVVLRRVRGN